MSMTEQPKRTEAN